MKHQPINLILSITLATQAHYVLSSPLLDTSDRRRQVAQQPTLPSNYWWPYGTSVTATVPATTVMPLIVSPTMVASVSSSTASSDSTTVSSTSTSDISSSSTTSTSSSSSISDPSTTAIDPQPTTHVHASRLSIPIIASIAGAAVGLGVLVLLLCRCCTRRRREYTTRRTSRRRRDGDAEKGWRLDNWEDKQQQRSWWNTLFSTRGEEVEDVVPGPRYVGVDDEVERSILLGRDEVRLESGGSGHRGGQLQDELLLAEKPRRSTRRPNHLLSSQPLMPSRSVSTTAIALADDESDQVGDEYEESKRQEQVPWESLRHKSIKRAILAKVDEERKWTDSMRGVRAANAAKGGVGRRQTHVRCDSDFWVSDARDGGFRIVAESPPQIPTPPSKTWTSLASSFPFFSRTESSGADEEDLEKESGGVDDRYTPAPARMRSNSKSRSRRGSITSPLRAMQRPTNAGAVQVLLRSPPTVMSPEMENALCFTPVLSASKSDWRIERSFDYPEYVESDGTRDSAPDMTSQERMQGQRSGAAVVPGTAFTKTYRLRTDRALKRVEAIVESGWTERGVATRIGRDGV
ncbi:hypothetical protein M378DRAFT_732570 [Amanita muscaria Koide BX008]|uniref:Uncharacterized protein n=1 Tax=Amanita muscaria (strain Koide BX008) TaxID=946122 RepID=A0A0C2SIR0_AMAMK|nr:hypothetical protein M378DRAFT_732570 [Amanita muscaria Koide BX008]